MAVITLGRSALVKANLVVSQGSDNLYRFRWSQKDAAGTVTPHDLTGYTGKAQMRAKVGAAIWVELSSPDEILLDADGLVTILLGDEITSAVEWNAYKAGVWDIELTSPTGVVTRFAEGSVTVSPDVTRVV
jgi:hypothetical protein